MQTNEITASQKVEPWNIKHVADELRDSFNACHTETERQCWRLVIKEDIRRILAGRAPTPGEQSILDHYGIHV